MEDMTEMTHMGTRQNEQGGVLWFILISVALIGILTAMLNRSGSSVDQAGNIEQMNIRISKVLRFAKSIESAVQNMKLNGISENDISFENSVTVEDYTNTGCDAAADQPWPSCLVFDERGAGLVYQKFSDLNDGSDWIFTGAINVGNADNPVGTYGSAVGNDLVMLLPNVSLSFCKQLNTQYGVGVAGTLPIDMSGVETNAFIGTFTGLSVLDGDPNPFELNSEPMGCFIDGNAAPNVRYFYYTLMAR